MQICHSLRCNQIDMLTADQLIAVLRINAGTPLSTFRSNAATLEQNIRLTAILHSVTPSSNK